ATRRGEIPAQHEEGQLEEPNDLRGDSSAVAADGSCYGAATPNRGPDTNPDTNPDTGPDTNPDTGPATGPATGQDSGPDTGPDTDTGQGPDQDSDASTVDSCGGYCRFFQPGWQSHLRALHLRAVPGAAPGSASADRSLHQAGCDQRPC